MPGGDREYPRSAVLIDFAASHPAYDLSFIQRIVHNGISVSRCILPPNSGSIIGSSQFTITVHEDQPLEMEWQLPSALQMERKIITPGMAHINPADHPIYQRWTGTPHILVIALDRSFLAPIIEEAFAPNGVDLLPQIGVQDPTIGSIVQGWRKELNEGGAGGRLFAEGLATVLVLHVYRTYSEERRLPWIAKGGLGPIRLNRVIAYIDANLDADMGLRDLAAIADVSPGHFGDQFKVSTGQTPFRFILRRRIGRAKELLLNRDMPIVDVALNVGFANQSHFTVNFRKLTGTTPARFRADTT